MFSTANIIHSISKIFQLLSDYCYHYHYYYYYFVEFFNA